MSSLGLIIIRNNDVEEPHPDEMGQFCVSRNVCFEIDSFSLAKSNRIDGKQ